MSRKPTKKQTMKAIDGSGGIMSTIATRLGVAWATARLYVNNWDETKALYEIENERVLDLAETTVLNSIKGGEVQDAKWLLSRKGKQRGYGEQVDVTTGGEKLTIRLVQDED